VAHDPAPAPLRRRLLPRTLFGRALLIIVTPLVVVQLVTTWFFYDRHWDTITRRLAGAVAGELALVVERQANAPDEMARRAALPDITNHLAMRIEMRPGEILPNTGADEGSGIVHRLLRREIANRVRRPFVLDTESRRNEVVVQIQTAHGVLEAAIDRDRLFSSTTHIFVLWTVGTSLVLFAVATLFMRNQVRPIRRLARAMDQFGRGQEVSDFRPSGATEVRQAASAFNVMRDRLQRMISQRTEMLAGVSHDLRTPLTRMKLQLAMLKGNDAEALRTDVSEMEKMLNDYLAFARGEGTEAVAKTDLSDILTEVVDGARRQGADIALETGPGMVVSARPNALRRCLTNVVANAIAHGERVFVHAGRAGDRIEIVVDDDGPGIPPDKREEVFRPFYRMEGSRSRETGGTGLGLTIARDVMRGHGGDITLDDSPAGGLRARLRLPA
jgi:two-component system osmolarity sensor histidine kinase EnvZ